MSVLIATAILLIGAGGYISCSLREEKEQQKKTQKRGYSTTAKDDGPSLFGCEGAFMTRKPEIRNCDKEPSILSANTGYSYSIQGYNKSQPELLCRETFEAKRKTA